MRENADAENAEVNKIMFDYLLYMHGGSRNHGCEAIVRSTCEILKEKDCTLFTTGMSADLEYEIDKVCKLKEQTMPTNRASLRYISALFQYHLLKDQDAYDRLTFRPILDMAANDTVALSIGGDNYCYGRPGHMYLINKYLREKGAKTVLWGCSVEPSQIDDEMRNDLAKYDLITARESLSYECLHQINSNTVLCPDPAFTLKTIKKELPDGFVVNNTVGINVSPLIMNYESSSGITLVNYYKLIEHILNDTDMHIALIPHVVVDGNSDLEPLMQLYDQFKESGRIVLIPDCNCMELKGYIAQCRFLVCARTHASIAAYSSLVPTLVVGYSTKAKGIATDIFGTDENYVIPVQSLSKENVLVERFDWLFNHESEIRKHMTSFMPGYCAKAYDAAKVLADI